MSETEINLKLQELFAPQVVSALNSLKEEGFRFVHYTSADNGLNIINSRVAWMRNASVMNDFMEIEHGQHCVAAAWASSHGDSLQSWWEGLFPGFVDEFVKVYNNRKAEMRSQTFLLSVSKHVKAEDGLGRLSMWRAYGAGAGVALVMNPAVFQSESDALKAYSAPVSYLSVEEFTSWFAGWASNIMAEEALFRQVGPQVTATWLFEAFRVFGLCTKHPGFREEQEWRVYHNPQLDGGNRLIKEYVSVRGIPQAVIKIPLQNIPDEGLSGLSVSELIEQVIIGPTEFPDQIFDAYADALARAGVENPLSRIRVSHIPLRQH